AEGRTREQHALQTIDKVLGVKHPIHAAMLINLADVDRRAGAWAHAIAGYHGALEAVEQALGPKHPFAAEALTGLGRAELGRGAPLGAVAPLERALGLREQAKEDPHSLAETRFALGRALVEGGRDPARGRRLVREAREAFAAEGARGRRALGEVDAWLAA